MEIIGMMCLQTQTQLSRLGIALALHIVDDQWLSLMTTWDRPIEQHDMVDYGHFLLPLVDLCFLSSLWNPKLRRIVRSAPFFGGAHARSSHFVCTCALRNTVTPLHCKV